MKYVTAIICLLFLTTICPGNIGDVEHGADVNIVGDLTVGGIGVFGAGLDAAGGSLINCTGISSNTNFLTCDAPEVTFDGGPAGIVKIIGSMTVEAGIPTILLNSTDEDSLNFIDFRNNNINRGLLGWREDEDALFLYSTGLIKFVVEKGLAYITKEGNFHTGVLSSDYRLDVKAGGVIGAIDPNAVLDDLTAGGTFNGTVADDIDYKVEIDANDTPDTFKWSDDGGSTWDAEDVNITGSAQTLNNGITVTFDANDGHTTGDYWEFTVTIHNPMWLQDAAGDGVMCVRNDGNVSISGNLIVTGGNAFLYGDLHLNWDNKNLYLGTANDASIYYDGTNLVINPKEVGTGHLSLLGELAATSLITTTNIGIPANPDLLALSTDYLSVEGDIRPRTGGVSDLGYPPSACWRDLYIEDISAAGTITVTGDYATAATATSAWELDGNGDSMPVASSFNDIHYDLDSNGDLMPTLLVYFVPDTNGDLMPTS